MSALSGSIQIEIPAAVCFAEPDWKGDADFDGLSGVIDLDSWLRELAQDIDDGARSGWLNAYQVRRATFDLQSIRCQLDFERQAQGPETSTAAFSAVLSRMDRLSRCLGSARSSH
jgi:hypothetical protein